MRKDIEFKSQGEKCRGWLYTPDSGKGPFPVVVMAGGWCYVKEIVMPHYADFFVKAGLSVLIFNYRCLGNSDGQPRQHVNPNDQIEDYKDAISFVETLPEVDPNRVGIWGISYSGGHVLVTGATDPRVKCIVSTIPVVDGYSNMQRVHGTVGFRKLMKAVMDDRRKRFGGAASEYIAMSAENVSETLCTWPFPETYKIFTDIQKTEAPQHEHRNTIESVELLMSYNVFPYLNRILNTPTLMLVAEGDDLTLWDLEIQAYNQIASARKKLFVIPNSSHMALYSDRSKLEIAAEAATAWLADHLVKPFK
ncbi:MAG: alpha/beta fold hydrolase [Pseudomonadota bacterium]